MKHTVCQMIVFVFALFLCVLSAPVSGQSTATKASAPAAPAAASAATEKAAASDSKKDVPAEPKTAASEQEKTSAPSDDSGAYQYFEYQVIAVPKRVLAAAAESLKISDSEPTDEMLPAIYKEGGYRVIGYSAGYSAANAPLSFKMSRTEYFPEFYILPKDRADFMASFGQDDADDEDDNGDDNGDDEENADGNDSGDDGDSGDEDGGDDEDDEEDDNDSYANYTNTYNNLASIFPFFGAPTVLGNEFFLDIRPPRIFSMESTMRKLNGFSNADYGDWGRGQSPVFDDNSFASTLAATKGKPMIVAKSMTGSTWTLHVFYTKSLPVPEKTTPATGSENKLVRLDFQIVRAKWNDICVAANSDGCPAVPDDDFMRKLMESSKLRDFYSPTFRLVPSQDPVSIQLNARVQPVTMRWIPAQDPGIPAIPLYHENFWTGTTLRAAARILSDEKTVQLDYGFEKVTQNGWRNYQYLYFGEAEEEAPAPVQNRYARPQPKPVEPEILSGTLKMPMTDTTSFRQTLFLEVGKPVLAARISNPAYQPDTLTLLFVTATVEDGL